MNLEQQREVVKDFTNKMIIEIEKKGNDYAGIDRLSNFKTRAVFLEIKPEQILLNDILHKVTRLKEIIANGKIPENETLQDTLLDLSCYSALAYCLLEENNELQKTDSKNIAEYVTNENARCSVCDVLLALGQSVHSHDICSYECYLQTLKF